MYRRRKESLALDCDDASENMFPSIKRGETDLTQNLEEVKPHFEKQNSGKFENNVFSQAVNKERERTNTTKLKKQQKIKVESEQEMHKTVKIEDVDEINKIVGEHQFEQSNGIEFKINLFDTPGIDRCYSLSKQQVKRAHGIALMYDLSDKQSFNSLDGWWNKLQDSAIENIPIVLVGNKSDL